MPSALLVLTLLVGSPSLSSPTALEVLGQLREREHAARLSGDQRARLEAIGALVKLLNGAPDALAAEARAFAEAGEAEHALEALGQLADLGQADHDLLTGKTHPFATLEEQPGYRSILERAAGNEAPVSRAETAFAFSESEAGLLPEDIDYDPRTGTFLVTSVLERKIVRVHLDGKSADFARSPSRWPMFAVRVDARRGLLWATEVALDGFTAAPKSDWGRSAVLCFDLRTGALRRRIEGPPRSTLGDMVLTREGVPLVSDGDGGGLYRVRGDRLERLDAGDLISPQTAAMLPDGRHALVPDYARGVGVLDLAGGPARWLDVGTPARHSLHGIDGLYFDRGSLIAIQNGASPRRVVRFRLDPALTTVVSEEIVERATATLGDPTHGVVVGKYFYYLAGTGWSELDAHGDLEPGSTLRPARVMRFQL